MSKKDKSIQVTLTEQTKDTQKQTCVAINDTTIGFVLHNDEKQQFKAFDQNDKLLSVTKSLDDGINEVLMAYHLHH